MSKIEERPEQLPGEEEQQQKYKKRREEFGNLGISITSDELFSSNVNVKFVYSEVLDLTFGTYYIVKMYIQSLKTYKWYFATFKFVPTFHVEKDDGGSWVPIGFNDVFYTNNHNSICPEDIINDFWPTQQHEFWEKLIINNFPKWSETITIKITDPFFRSVDMNLFKSFDMTLIKIKKKSLKI